MTGGNKFHDTFSQGTIATEINTLDVVSLFPTASDQILSFSYQNQTENIRTARMWNSVTLKRSLMHIGKTTKAPLAIGGAVGNPPYPCGTISSESRRAWSHSPEDDASSSSSSSSSYRESDGTVNASKNGDNDRIIHPSGTNGRGILRFDPARASRPSSAVRGFGTSAGDGSSSVMHAEDHSGDPEASSSFSSSAGERPLLPGDEPLLLGTSLSSPENDDDDDTYFPPMGGRSSPAEQLASLMKHSYYYASYKARDEPNPPQ